MQLPANRHKAGTVIAEHKGKNGKKYLSFNPGLLVGGTTATMDFQDGIPAMPPTANNLQLLKNIVMPAKTWDMGPLSRYRNK